MWKGTWRVALLGLLLAGAASGEEGKWTPEQVPALDPAWLRQLGLRIPPGDLWSAAGAGSLAATMRVSGCSATFVSPQGLVVTNYHCAFGILQQHSTRERDLLAGGFLAGALGDELPGKTDRAAVPFRTRDVSAEIEHAVPTGADDLLRFRAIERRSKELVAECEKTPNRRCEVAKFDGGVRYVLYENLEYSDVRLVYAPPRGVGEYGGEVDNWSWPRHTGDFALLRICAAPDGSPAPYAVTNVPLEPSRWFRISTQGVAPDDFVMIAGYPGRTYRSYIAAEMRERAERFFPRRSELFAAWIGILEEESKRNPDAALALAERIKELANREKNARGQVDGLRRGHTVERKAAADAAALAWARSRPEFAAAASAYGELERLVADRDAAWDRDFLLGQADQGPEPLALAATLVRAAVESAKPDLEREPEYMERNRKILARELERAQTEMWAPAETALCADLFTRLAALPQGQRSPAADAFLAGAHDAAAVRGRCETLAGSPVMQAGERAKMFGESVAQLQARQDPLLELAFALDPELRAQRERRERFDGAVSRLRPQWLRAVAAKAGKPIAPDANSTLRVSFGHVRGYAPRDAVWMNPQTTLAGMAAKHTGSAPFDAPPGVLTAAPTAPASRWADPRLHDVPVAFLADLDTTGGNSGSGVFNGKGELVGVNFDRVWENVANDFGYNPDVARNISVDVRYLLWMLETQQGASAARVFAEMGIPAK